MHAPGDARAVESPFEGRVDLGLATRVQFRHVATEKAQVQAPVQSQTQSAASGKLHGPGNLEVGVLTLKRDGFYVERVARCAEVNHSGVFQVDAGEIHGHAREIRVRDDVFQMAKRAFQRNVAIGIGMAAETLEVQSREQERVQANVLDGDLAAEVVGFAQDQRGAAGYLSGGHSRAQVEVGRDAVRFQMPFKTADYRFSDRQINDTEGSFAPGRHERAIRLHPETQLSTDRQTG